MQRMAALVTGGAGFIGTRLVEKLVRLGWSVTSLDLFPAARPLGGVRYIRGDVRNPDAVTSALQGCNRVFHLAAAHHDSGIPAETYFDVNERGTQVLLDAMTGLHISDICFYSSVAVYGATGAAATEQVPPQPVSDYGRSKLAAERCVEAWAKEASDRKATVVRPTVVFGPRNFANMYSLIRAIDRRRYLQVGRGDNIKSLAYVDNLVDATVFVLDHAQRGAYEVFNYADKEDLTSREIAATIAAGLGTRLPTVGIPLDIALLLAAPFDALGWLLGRDLDISRARVRKFAQWNTVFAADLVFQRGFRPAIDLKDGIRDMVAWYRDMGSTQPLERRLPPRQAMAEILVEA